MRSRSVEPYLRRRETMPVGVRRVHQDRPSSRSPPGTREISVTISWSSAGESARKSVVSEVGKSEVAREAERGAREVLQVPKMSCRSSE